MGISGAKGMKRSIFALVAVLPMSCGQMTVQPTAADGQVSEGDLGTLSLTSEAFPAGAETLVLNITRTDLVRPCVGTRPEYISAPAAAGEGLGLSQVADSVNCRLPHPITRGALDSVNKPDFGWQKIIKVKKGEQISPVQLRSGAYYANASFYNAQSVLLYRGEEKFALASGEKKSIKINLKKVDSGEITIGFEFEKPAVIPTRISSDSHLELRKTRGFRVLDVEKNIDLDLANGVAVTSAKCIDQKNCKGQLASKKIGLTKTALRKILEITDSVNLKDGQKDLICADPLEYIAIIVKKCKECEVGKQYKFSNTACGTPTHSLTSQQFDEIWTAIHSINSRMDTAVVNP